MAYMAYYTQEAEGWVIAAEGGRHSSPELAAVVSPLVLGVSGGRGSLYAGKGRAAHSIPARGLVGRASSGVSKDAINYLALRRLGQGSPPPTLNIRWEADELPVEQPASSLVSLYAR